jgi:hypothetical protein
MKKFCFFGVLLLLIGFGCQQQQDLSPEDQSRSLNLSPDSSLTLKQTVFGLGGLFAQTFSGDDLAEYKVNIKTFSPGDAASFSWSNSFRQETAESVAAREAYAAAKHPIGDSAVEPEPVYEIIEHSGEYSAVALASSQKIFPPSLWPDGGQVFDDNSLLWLSCEQYQGLVENKETQLSLGLFDEKLAAVVGWTDAVQNFLNKLQQNAEEASRGEDIYKLTAENEWQDFSLKINGEEKTVRAIKASNWFGSYIILANENNPLILKLTLNPFALGSLDLSSPVSSFLGYEVTEIEIR